MKEYIGQIIWAIFTVVVASMMIHGYNVSQEEKAKVPYRCYVNIDMKKGFFEGDTTPRFTYSELVNLDEYDGFIVDKDKSIGRTIELTFNPIDNPTIEKGKITCFSF